MYVFIMSLMYAIFVAAFDLAGVFFNIRLLKFCLRLNSTKDAFVQICRILAVCHCACQVMILLTDAVEWWEGFQNLADSCNIFRALSICMMALQALNTTVIVIINSHHWIAYRNHTVSRTIRSIASLHIGATLSWWWCHSSCVPEELVPLVAFITVYFASLAFAFLLAPPGSRKDIYDEVKNRSPESSQTACSLLWNLSKEEVIPFFLKIYLPMYLVVLLTFPSSPSLLEISGSSFVRYIVGIVIPPLINDLIFLGYKDIYEKKVVVI